jgi:hypothetical protein
MNEKIAKFVRECSYESIKANTSANFLNPSLKDIHSRVARECYFNDLENGNYYRIQDGFYTKASASKADIKADYSEMERRCLEFKQYLEANPEAFKNPSKVIVVDSLGGSTNA